MSIASSLISSFAKITGIRLIKESAWQSVLGNELQFLPIWKKLSHAEKESAKNLLPSSQSQYGQDLVALLVQKSIGCNKFFVEFGATDGIQWSNTYSLEKSDGWAGILAEPARCYQEQLRENRKCYITSACISDGTRETDTFVEVQNPNERFKTSSPELSSLKSSMQSDWASDIRNNNAIEYDVRLATLDTVLKEANAPRNIGYLSIDVEGNEESVLDGIDFKTYSFGLITIEINSSKEKRLRITRRLKNAGYTQILEELSAADAFFVQTEYIGKIGSISI